MGYADKVAESVLNCNLPSDEAQRMLSHALEQSAEYSEQMVVPLTPEAAQVNNDYIATQVQRLVDLNFRSPSEDLQHAVKRIYNNG